MFRMTYFHPTEMCGAINATMGSVVQHTAAAAIFIPLTHSMEAQQNSTQNDDESEFYYRSTFESCNERRYMARTLHCH